MLHASEYNIGTCHLFMGFYSNLYRRRLGRLSRSPRNRDDSSPHLQQHTGQLLRIGDGQRVRIITVIVAV